jgi:hypothetical protein
MRTSTALALTALAVLFTLLNAVKPLLIDDSAYQAYAEHIARHPLDPYGFTMFWWQWPLPANEVLAPPVLPYWWSLAIRLFGDDPLLWKLWLFPFCLLFVGSLYQLLHRFARGLEMPLAWMTVLSPTFLPSLNLMLDVPALALSLAAIVLFIRAADGDSFVLAAVAGAMAGLAIETKYTGFLAPAAMAIYAVFFRKLRLWGVAAFVAGCLFIAWEAWIACCYGESHFLFHLRDNTSTLQHKLMLFLPILTILGGVAAPLVLLGLTAAGWSWRTVLGVGAMIGLGYALVGFVPDEFTTFTRDPDSGQERLTLNNAIFGLFGLVLFGITGGVSWQMFRASDPQERGTGLGPAPVEWFLLLWLGLEIAGYFALTPFPAVRRVLGIVVVMTLLIGRLASRTCLTRERRALIHGVALAGIALGLLFYEVNRLDAEAEKRGAEQAAAWVREQQPQAGATVWYVGHWGFQYYAGREGMTPVVPDSSCLRTGDWLVMPDDNHNQQLIVVNPRAAHAVHQIDVTDSVPLRTVVCYFGGRTPLERHERPRLQVTIYRVEADFCPPTRR